MMKVPWCRTMHVKYTLLDVSTQKASNAQQCSVSCWPARQGKQAFQTESRPTEVHVCKNSGHAFCWTAETWRILDEPRCSCSCTDTFLIHFLLVFSLIHHLLLCRKKAWWSSFSEGMFASLKGHRTISRKRHSSPHRLSDDDGCVLT